MHRGDLELNKNTINEFRERIFHEAFHCGHVGMYFHEITEKIHQAVDNYTDEELEATKHDVKAARETKGKDGESINFKMKTRGWVVDGVGIVIDNVSAAIDVQSPVTGGDRAYSVDVDYHGGATIGDLIKSGLAKKQGYYGINARSEFRRLIPARRYDLDMVLSKDKEKNNLTVRDDLESVMRRSESVQGETPESYKEALRLYACIVDCLSREQYNLLTEVDDEDEDMHNQQKEGKSTMIPWKDDKAARDFFSVPGGEPWSILEDQHNKFMALVPEEGNLGRVWPLKPVGRVHPSSITLQNVVELYLEALNYGDLMQYKAMLVKTHRVLLRKYTVIDGIKSMLSGDYIKRSWEENPDPTSLADEVSSLNGSIGLIGALILTITVALVMTAAPINLDLVSPLAMTYVFFMSLATYAEAVTILITIRNLIVLNLVETANIQVRGLKRVLHLTEG